MWSVLGVFWVSVESGLVPWSVDRVPRRERWRVLRALLFEVLWVAAPAEVSVELLEPVAEVLGGVLLPLAPVVPELRGLAPVPLLVSVPVVSGTLPVLPPVPVPPVVLFGKGAVLPVPVGLLEVPVPTVPGGVAVPGVVG